MVKLAGVGDLHIALKHGTRTDDILDTFYKKYTDVVVKAKSAGCEAIIITGDIFDGAAATKSVLAQNELAISLAIFFDSLSLKSYTIIGNHDLVGYNMESFKQTTLNLVAELSKGGLQIIHHTTEIAGVEVRPAHYTKDIDAPGTLAYEGSKNSLLVAHGMLVPEPKPFKDLTLIKDVHTSSPVVLCGHYHEGFKPIVHDETVFINPGSLLRLASSSAKRVPKFVIIEVESHLSSLEFIASYDVEVIHEPGTNVFDMAKVEEGKRQKEYMEKLHDIILSGETDIDAMVLVRTIHKELGLADVVLARALDYITV